MPSSIENQQQERLTAARSADHQHFILLIELYQKLLLKVCWAYTYTTHDRDDLFQEIAGRLWAAFGNYDRSRPFSTWMYRVALNVAIDFRRRRLGRESATLNLDLAMDTAARQDESKQEQLQELRELLEQQNEVDRAILLLYLEGNSYREIAEIIGISESNVGTRFSRLKKSLRESVHPSEK